MSARTRFALVLAAVIGSVILCLFAGLPSRSGVSAQTAAVLPDRPAAFPASAFYGDSASAANGFFYKSLLSIYQDRYVPQPVASGHFSTAGSQQGSRVSRRPAAPAAQASGQRPTTIQLLKGAVTVDPTIDASPQQRQILPDVLRMIGPVSQDRDLRDLPYIAPTKREGVEPRLTRHPPKEEARKDIAPSLLKVLTGVGGGAENGPSIAPTIPAPFRTFEGIDSNASGCGCLPPDTDGDVGSNHYVQSENSSIRITDKLGNFLAGPITYNSFFSAMGTATPCGNNQNGGDGVVFYDHMADRWIISDFASPAFPGTLFYQCIGVAKTADPVSGGWYLYAVQVDPSNPSYLGDYPKFGLWPDAYYLSMNEFSNNTTFNGVRVYALDRNSMVTGGSANAIGFSILPADLGDQYSLVPASFRTGSNPPAGQAEWFMDVNSSAVSGTVETQVFVRRFHADFVTPLSSTFGVGAAHNPDGIITVNGFKGAYTSTAGTQLVPNGTATTTQWLDTLGDKLMYPLVYQNRGGTESVYAVQTTAPSNTGATNTGPTAINWYQFNMTGNTIPATPTQQQEFTNGGDGLYRDMPSINVDNSGNVLIGYTASSATVDPSIRYAGRLAGDPPNTLAQGEAVMTSATGHQTSTSGRWGDYSSMFVDPSNGCTFYHTNEYYSVTSSASWRTKVGLIRLPSCVVTPVPVFTPTPTPVPTVTPTPAASAGPITVTATTGTMGPTDYSTLQLAFAAINAGTHTGSINVTIVGDTTEGATATLNASGVGSASYSSMFIQPAGIRTVSGNLAAPLVNLDGADNVTIDGLNTGGNSLTLTNTSTSATAGTSTIRFISSTAAAGGASNNVVRNCSILGSSTVAVGTAGGNVLFSTATASSTAVVGNNYNLISKNNIGPAGGSLPTKAVSAVGSTGNNLRNIGNVIDGNNIFDFFNTGANTTGIDIRTGNNDWVISNNRIYQTAPRVFASTALRYAGITLSGTSGTSGDYNTISGNIIGFGAANGTGTTTISGSSNEFRGIDLQGANSLTATSVQGNVISGIDQTSSRSSTATGLSAFAGIQVSTSAGASATGVFDIGTVTGNTIGSLDGSSTIVINASSVTASTTPIFGILAFSGSSDTVSNNKMGAITIQGSGTVTGFRGIFSGATAGTTHTVYNNTIGGAVAGGAINDTQLGTYALYGIQTSTAAANITGNTIRNINGNANVSGSVNESGIAFTSTSTTAVSTISRNTVYSLTNTSGAVATNIYGIDVGMSTTAAVGGNLVERNFVHSLNVVSTDTTSQLYGIIIRGANTSGTATATVQNNMVRLGIDAAGNPITAGLLIRGIRDSAAGAGGNTNNSYFFNSVYIGGSGVASSSNTTAFYSDQVTSLTSPRMIKDNIFFNARSNASGTGKNYAIAVGGTAPNPTGLTSNYNDLFANGTGGFTGLFNTIDQTTLADWQTATGQDANSISADPKFITPDGTARPIEGGKTVWETISNLILAPLAVVDLHLQPTSPAIGVGTAVSSTAAAPLVGVTNDFDGNLRTMPVDMGATRVTAPTAAKVDVSGRVTTADGAGLRNAVVVLRDANGGVRTATTGAFGYYTFTEVEAGSYVMAVASKRYNFTSRVVTVNDTLTDVDFMANF